MQSATNNDNHMVMADDDGHLPSFAYDIPNAPPKAMEIINKARRDGRSYKKIFEKEAAKKHNCRLGVDKVTGVNVVRSQKQAVVDAASKFAHGRMFVYCVGSKRGEYLILSETEAFELCKLNVYCAEIMPCPTQPTVFVVDHESYYPLADDDDPNAALLDPDAPRKYRQELLQFMSITLEASGMGPAWEDVLVTDASRRVYKDEKWVHKLSMHIILPRLVAPTAAHARGLAAVLNNGYPHLADESIYKKTEGAAGQMKLTLTGKETGAAVVHLPVLVDGDGNITKKLSRDEVDVDEWRRHSTHPWVEEGLRVFIPDELMARDTLKKSTPRTGGGGGAAVKRRRVAVSTPDWLDELHVPSALGPFAVSSSWEKDKHHEGWFQRPLRDCPYKGSAHSSNRVLLCTNGTEILVRCFSSKHGCGAKMEQLNLLRQRVKVVEDDTEEEEEDDEDDHELLLELMDDDDDEAEAQVLQADDDDEEAQVADVVQQPTFAPPDAHDVTSFPPQLLVFFESILRNQTVFTHFAVPDSLQDLGLCILKFCLAQDNVQTVMRKIQSLVVQAFMRRGAEGNSLLRLQSAPAPKFWLNDARPSAKGVGGSDWGAAWTHAQGLVTAFGAYLRDLVIPTALARVEAGEHLTEDQKEDVKEAEAAVTAAEERVAKTAELPSNKTNDARRDTAQSVLSKARKKLRTLKSDSGNHAAVLGDRSRREAGFLAVELVLGRDCRLRLEEAHKHNKRPDSLFDELAVNPMKIPQSAVPIADGDVFYMRDVRLEQDNELVRLFKSGSSEDLQSACEELRRRVFERLPLVYGRMRGDLQFPLSAQFGPDGITAAEVAAASPDEFVETMMQGCLRADGTRSGAFRASEGALLAESVFVLSDMVNGSSKTSLHVMYGAADAGKSTVVKMLEEVLCPHSGGLAGGRLSSGAPPDITFIPSKATQDAFDRSLAHVCSGNALLAVTDDMDDRMDKPLQLQKHFKSDAITVGVMHEQAARKIERRFSHLVVANGIQQMTALVDWSLRQNNVRLGLVIRVPKLKRAFVLSSGKSPVTQYFLRRRSLVLSMMNYILRCAVMQHFLRRCGVPPLKLMEAFLGRFAPELWEQRRQFVGAQREFVANTVSQLKDHVEVTPQRGFGVTAHTLRALADFVCPHRDDNDVSWSDIGVLSRRKREGGLVVGQVEAVKRFRDSSPLYLLYRQLVRPHFRTLFTDARQADRALYHTKVRWVQDPKPLDDVFLEGVVLKQTALVKRFLAKRDCPVFSCEFAPAVASFSSYGQPSSPSSPFTVQAHSLDSALTVYPAPKRTAVVVAAPVHGAEEGEEEEATLS